ncbi:MAG: hypothetical protein J0H77_01005 [Alphaproteobacteria bacterium]|nr:hypothetical protein [Alphaproteobacteria bacterium]
MKSSAAVSAATSRGAIGRRRFLRSFCLQFDGIAFGGGEELL